MLSTEQNNSSGVKTLDKRDFFALFILGTLGAVVLIFAAINSVSYAYLTGDDYNHYLFAISSPQNLEFLFSGWGKPLFTLSLLIFLLATGQSLEGARFLNCCLHLSSVLLIYILARRLSLRCPSASLVGILVFLAPQNLELSQSILTEPLFTVILLLTFLAYIEKKYQISFVLAGFSLLARSEGLFIIAVLLLVHYYQFKSLQALKDGALSILPPVLVSLMTTLLFSQPFLAFFPPNYGIFQMYGHGQPLHYILGTFNALGAPMMFLSLIGIGLWMERNCLSKTGNFNPAIMAFLAFGLIIVMFHDLIWTLGLFGSWGTLRHLAPTAPIFAYFAGYTFQRSYDYFDAHRWNFNKILGSRLKISVYAIGFSLVVLVSVFWTSYHANVVTTPTVTLQVSEKVVDWLKSNRPDAIADSQNLFIYSPVIIALLGLSYPDVPNRMGRLIDREMLETHLNPGGIVVWDSHHGPLEGQTPLSYFEDQFQELFMWTRDSEGNIVNFSIYVFLKL
ncbi:MAG: hypothetical protein ACFFDI_22910 [Promethearchaeota archaeon]